MPGEGRAVVWDEIIHSADMLMSTLPPVRLKAFAEAALVARIQRKEVCLFQRPPCITRYTDTDEVLLEKFLMHQEKEADRRYKVHEEVLNGNLLLAVSSAISGFFKQWTVRETAV